MFIKLTSSTGLNEGKPIYVNMDRIVYFREMENPSQKGSFMVDATNEIIKVKEKPDEIVTKMVTFQTQEMMAQNYVQNPFAYGIPSAPFQLDPQIDGLWSAEWREQCNKENRTITDAGNQSTEDNSR